MDEERPGGVDGEDAPGVVIPSGEHPSKRALRHDGEGIFQKRGMGKRNRDGVRARGAGLERRGASAGLYATRAAELANGGLLAQGHAEHGDAGGGAGGNDVVEEQIAREDELVDVDAGGDGAVEPATRDDKRVVLHPCKLYDLQVGDGEVNGEATGARALGEGAIVRDLVAEHGQGVVVALVEQGAHRDAIVHMLAEQEVSVLSLIHI